jgi:hypothetical protein
LEFGSFSMKKWFLAIVGPVIFLSSAHCQFDQDDELLVHLMLRQPERFHYLIDHKDSLEIQIIYTQINRDANNLPKFRSFYFNIDSNRYFYPASTVKLPIVLLSLEKLHQLRVKGLDKFTPMLTDSVYFGHENVAIDSTSETGLPSIAHYIKKILIVSDNDAYNRLYEFMGQQEANDRLRKKGYTIRLLHRLERSLTPNENRHTEAIRFIRNDTLVYRQPMLMGDSISVSDVVLKGVGYYKNDTLIHQPFDFSYKNFYPLTEQQQLLRALIFPRTVPVRRRFDIPEADRQFVLKYMSQLPAETMFPPYFTDTTYYPAYGKFLMFGNSKDPLPEHLRIFNKIGDAYGYLIDNAYIIDLDRNVEFMLSAVIHANTDGIYNDGKYEYKTLGYPFLRNLGQLIYSHELRRVRLKKPDLREFKFDYDR